MFLWWPRILPFIGVSWMACDRYGNELSGEYTGWAIRVFLASWFDYTIIFGIWGWPVKVDPDTESGV